MKKKTLTEARKTALNILLNAEKERKFKEENIFFCRDCGKEISIDDACECRSCGESVCQNCARYETAIPDENSYCYDCFRMESNIRLERW